ncbi:MAG TPA: DsbA family protein [Acidimicrobiales bacterium]
MNGIPFLATPVSVADHSRGPDDAALIVVEYGDYQCPYCDAARIVVDELLKNFRESLRFVFRNFPLADVYPHAKKAAVVAEAVGLQGKFWEMHDVLFDNQWQLDDEALLRYAAQVGADVHQMMADLGSGALRRVESDFESALRSGANATPTFFVNGVRYDGPLQYQPLADYLQEVLDQ